MPSVGWIGPCSALALTIGERALIGEEVDGVRRMVPQQMIGPRARLAERVHVGAAEEIGLHVHLIDMELAGQNLLVDKLMARVEATGVAAHRDEPGALLHRDDGFRVLQTVGERNLDLHMLAGFHALQRLRGVHLGRRRQNDGVELRELEAVGKIGRHVTDAVIGRGLLRLVELAADQRDDFDPVDQLDPVEMLEAEGAGARQRDLDGVVMKFSEAP